MFLQSSEADTLNISQSGNEMVIEQRWKASIESGAYRRVLTYKLDGSESDNLTTRGINWTSSTSWDADMGLLVTPGQQEVGSGRRSRTIDITETRMLSEDGQTLTLASTTNESRRGETTTTMIFKKVTS